MTDLPMRPGDEVSLPYGINEGGQAVGISADEGGSAFHAVLWNNGTIVDLQNSLDSSGIGWRPNFPTDIDNDGWIAGIGTNPNGETRGFLLTPAPVVPEPDTALDLVRACDFCPGSA